MNDVCRTCLRSSRGLLPLFGDTKLPHKIKTISSIEVSVDDNLPDKVCAECIVNISLSYNFRRVIINSDTKLRDHYASTQKRECENEIVEDTDKDSSVVDVHKLNIKDEDVNLGFADDTENNIDNQPVDILKEDKVVEVKLDKELTTFTENTNILEKEINTRKITSKRRSFKNKLFKCDKCDFECLGSKKYRHHLQNHVTKMCTICGKFISALNIKKHISTHTDSPVSCEKCGKICKNRESLRGHLLIHKGINRTCKICGETYTEKGVYFTHLRSHKSEEEKSAKCPLCDKILCSKQVLKKHIRSHTGERPYPCDFCNKGFSSSNALKTHRRQHTNERPYKCAVCSMAFPQRVSLRTHLKSKHQMGTIDNILNSS